ncbi:MAG: DNA polymerase III subunit gamma/tau [Chloroflexi bacterium]|nr:DNA polymerase III subunit gamma/tau [Chloroflexota bacterium]
MDSQALYRKWRPQTLSDVAGQEPVTRALKNALERGRIVHAYLFCGPRGTGKTSTGRILAKAVNCLAGGHGDPCNNCAMCRAVTSGAALDVIEIDAASNRGIEEIRDLREKVNFSPSQARHKVYIIDEVHMLTDAAANALLKTLEEPPPYVIFVLATTESHKLLPTILSRCQRYDFRRLTQPAIAARLSQVCAGEGFDVQPEALNLIAKGASGSLRDAVNLLEQMVNFYGTRVELAQVQSILGVTGDQRSREIARHIAARDTAAALHTLDAVVRDGLDLRQFQRELVEYMRQLLLVKCGSTSAVDATAEDIKEMQGIVESTSLDHIVESVKLLGKVDLRLDAYSPLPLELAVVECGMIGEGASTRKTRPAEAKPRQAAPQAPTPQRPAPVQTPPAMARTPAAAPTAATPAPATLPRQAPATPVPAREQAPSDWEKVLREIRVTNKNLEALLRSCEPSFEDDGVAVLRFAHGFHKDKVEAPDKIKVIEEAILKVTGKPRKVQCVLQEREKKPQRQSGPQGHLVQAALKMGAKIVATEEKHAE